VRLALSLIAAVAASCLAASASAQIRPLSVELSAFGGFWEGDAVLDAGPTFGGRAQFNLNRVFGLEATYGATLTTLTLDADEEATSQVESDEIVSQFGFNGVLNLNDGALTPFVTAGAGFVSIEEVDFATNVGLGAKYYFTDMFAARVDFRGWFSGEAPADDEYAHFEITAGITVQLGGDDDLDDDGVKNRADKCPTQAEDKDGFEDEDGCPELDNDKDGVEDADDQCPLEAEDKDGDKDDDGCPDLDDDGDGLANDKDKCPAEAEDKDGFEDEDGCPDPDNDKDGIEDAKDKCPGEPESKNGIEDEDGCPEQDADGDGLMGDADKCPEKAENINGFQDEDGCPDEIPEELKAVLGPQKLSFYKNELTAAAHVRLDAIAAVLARYPEVVYVVAATSTKGDDKMAWSLDRAKAAIAYLARKGVAEANMKAKGLGDADLPADAPEGVRKDRLEISIDVKKPIPKK
jgi:outer membrane protein OmpA-like peptidoglycan-associated protein